MEEWREDTHEADETFFFFIKLLLYLKLVTQLNVSYSSLLQTILEKRKHDNKVY